VWDETQRRFVKVKVDGDYKSVNSRTQIVTNEFTQMPFEGSTLSQQLNWVSALPA
jgi:hypothetical protein